ncbi:MAG: SpoIIE family protein phosphatase [Pyrinomonadaceae bacterium]|nr:SpoIIE family protein phosphatase [Sphingobacteriaceae bacterium]
MVSATHTSFIAKDRSYLAILKRDIHKIALEAGFSELKLAKLDIIVAEMTSNLVKYTDGGELLVCVSGEKNKEYLELICLDSGPGMADPDRMMMDGMSTSKTLGAGLGSMKRLSDFFQIYSIPKWGTILLCRMFKNEAPKDTPKQVVLRSLVVAMPGEKVSGDGGAYKLTADYFKLLVADGLGHGVEANLATAQACAAFKICPYHDPAEIIKFIHQSIKQTRGAVGTVAVYDFKSKIWSIAGVGNISTRMVSYQNVRNIMSYNGIIGHNIPNTFQSQKISAQDFQQMVLCSDGVKNKWDITKYPRINNCDLSILAAALYKDNARRTDDMSIVISKVLV